MHSSVNLVAGLPIHANVVVVCLFSPPEKSENLGSLLLLLLLFCKGKVMIVRFE